MLALIVMSSAVLLVVNLETSQVEKLVKDSIIVFRGMECCDMLDSITCGIMVAMLLAFLGIAFASVVITVCVVKDMKFWHDRELLGDDVEKSDEVDK